MQEVFSLYNENGLNSPESCQDDRIIKVKELTAKDEGNAPRGGTRLGGNGHVVKDKVLIWKTNQSISQYSHVHPDKCEI